MKISINQMEFQNALTVVTKGISGRSTLPILSGVYLKASQDRLILQTTDLELSVQYSIDTLIEEEGETVVPAKLLFEIIKSLPDAAVSLVLINDSIVVTCGSSSFSLKTLNPEDFPGFPHVEAHQRVTLPFDIFSSMVKKVSRVVSKDESRAILTGVLISLENKHLKMVATDSYRLAISEYDIKEIQENTFEAVISGTFLQDIVSVPKINNEISLDLAENQIIVTYGNTVFINRRIEGNFPNYKQLLPDNYITRAKVNLSQLVGSVKRVALLNNIASPIRFDVNLDSQTIQLFTIAQDVGSAQETLTGNISGENTEIAFNYAYIIDGLSAISTENVYLEIQNSMKPGIFRSEEEENFLYLIMPVRIS